MSDRVAVTVSRGHAHLQLDANSAGCFHGGAFFEAIGEGFATLERRHQVINADVLDAWFPPAPGVVAALRDHLDWIIRTSPPTYGEGMARAIAAARRVPESSVVLGAGSSDLIFLAFPHWLTRQSRVLLLDPTYGEYEHILRHVIGCRVDRLVTHRTRGYQLAMEDLEAGLAKSYDLVVLVNPNSPTGQHVDPDVLAHALRRARDTTLVWIDETYVDYVGAEKSLELFASTRPNVVVCKSMSKVYALSGVRAAYLVTSRERARDLRTRTPPWAVSLAAQISAVRALEDPGYYRDRYAQTAGLRRDLALGLERMAGIDVVPGVANFLLCHLADWRPKAAEVVAACRALGLFVRDAGSMSASLGTRSLRIAVKDHGTNERMLEILSNVLAESL